MAADQAKTKILKDAGLQDVDKLPEAAVEALAKLSNNELAVLAKVQRENAELQGPMADFGGVVF